MISSYRGSDAKFDMPAADCDGDFIMPNLIKVATVEATEARPPTPPYTWEVFAPNTFTGDSNISSLELYKKVKEIIIASPADIIPCNSEWKFKAVFYPNECKTSFEVCIWDDASSKNCLVEFQLHEGDRFAFQGLVSYVQSRCRLSNAFANEWGLVPYSPSRREVDFDVEAHLDAFAGGYKHTSIAPPPLPSHLLDTIAIPAQSNELVELLFEHACSSFLDVQSTAWQGLANKTKDVTAAEALLQARVDGQECVSLAAAVLKRDATSDLDKDTQRCALKTLLNIAQTKADVCDKIHALLGKEIITLSKGPTPNETQRIAIALSQLFSKSE